MGVKNSGSREFRFQFARGAEIRRRERARAPKGARSVRMNRSLPVPDLFARTGFERVLSGPRPEQNPSGCRSPTRPEAVRRPGRSPLRRPGRPHLFPVRSRTRWIPVRRPRSRSVRGPSRPVRRPLGASSSSSSVAAVRAHRRGVAALRARQATRIGGSLEPRGPGQEK